jgi:hypothetical protein
VPAHSTVSIDNNFAAGNAGIAFWAADDESSSRVNQVSGLLVEQLERHYFFDQKFDQRFAHFLLFHVSGML